MPRVNVIVSSWTYVCGGAPGAWQAYPRAAGSLPSAAPLQKHVLPGPPPARHAAWAAAPHGRDGAGQIPAAGSSNRSPSIHTDFSSFSKRCSNTSTAGHQPSRVCHCSNSGPCHATQQLAKWIQLVQLEAGGVLTLTRAQPPEQRIMVCAGAAPASKFP